jgi:hypothetical protein
VVPVTSTPPAGRRGGPTLRPIIGLLRALARKLIQPRRNPPDGAEEPGISEETGTSEQDADTARAINVVLEEYKGLRSEISDRVKNEFVLVTASVTLTGAATALLSQSAPARATLLLAIPLLSFALGFLHFAQESSIAVAAAYIHQRLRPNLRALVGDTGRLPFGPLEWEEFRREKLYRAPIGLRVVLGIGSFSAVIPGLLVFLAAVGLTAFSANFRTHLHTLEYVLLAIDALFALTLSVMMYWIDRLYKAITVAT